MTCSACGGTELEPGFIDDVAQGRVRWLAGKFQKGLFGNSKGRTSRFQAAVIAYRCTQCSHLQLYAGPA